MELGVPAMIPIRDRWSPEEEELVRKYLEEIHRLRPKDSSSSPLLNNNNSQELSRKTSRGDPTVGSLSLMAIDHKEAASPLLKGGLISKAFLRWVFIVLNVALEVCQAVLTQEAAQHKMGPHNHLNLAIIVTSSVCLIISLVEAFVEGTRGRVVWQKRGHCCWFYYPGTQGRLFGRFSLYFGIICSMVQLVINLIEELAGKNFMQFHYVPLLLSVGYLIAAVIAPRQKLSSVAMVKCKTHGCSAAEFTTMDDHESPVFECPRCRMESIT